MVPEFGGSFGQATGRRGDRGLLRAIAWTGDGLSLLDQTRLPGEEHWVRCSTVEEVASAIREMKVRGAPAIGIAAAFGVVLAVKEALRRGGDPWEAAGEAVDTLAATRPTAVHLFWALDRMRRAVERLRGGDGRTLAEMLEAEASAMAEEDEAINRAIGRWGKELVPDGARILTHCNTGALATGGYGTALGIVRAAAEAGKRVQVWVGETRPFLQGARLTAYELLRDGIDATVITDSTAGALMAKGWVDAVIVGADRIAANGDVANKIGTYSLAVLAQFHDIPFYVAAPVSTFDPNLEEGGEIPIEERDPREVLEVAGVAVAPRGAKALHWGFDVTPHRLVSAIVTEKGILRAPYGPAIRRLGFKSESSGGESLLRSRGGLPPHGGG